MEDNEEVRVNDINEDILGQKAKSPDFKDKVTYILLAVLIIIASATLVLFVLNYKKEGDSKKNSELVTAFFKDGYQFLNFDNVMTYMSDDYYDHSPAHARSNIEAVNILKSVQTFFTDISVDLLDLTCGKDMVAARILFKVVHTGTFNGIPATGKTMYFEALENFKITNGKIVESWGYWPEKEMENKLKSNSTLNEI